MRWSAPEAGAFDDAAGAHRSGRDFLARAGPDAGCRRAKSLEPKSFEPESFEPKSFEH
jgi:hypothetical protein